LVVTRVVGEGNDDDDDDDDDGGGGDQRVFVLDEALGFVGLGDANNDKGKALGWVWVDPLDTATDPLDTATATDKTTVFEAHLPPAVAAASAAAFEALVYASMYERRAAKPHADASVQELDAYVAFVQAQARATHAKLLPANPLPSTPAKQVNNNNPAALQQSTPIRQLARSPVDPMSIGSTPLAINSKHVKNNEKKNTLAGPEGESIVKFNRMRENVRAEIIRTARFEFSLLISSAPPDDPQTFIAQPLDSTMNPQFNAHASCFVWLWKADSGGEDAVVYPWSIKFADAVAEALFRDAFGACMYETLNKTEFLKVKEADQKWLTNAYLEDVEMDDAEREAQEEEEEQQEELESETDDDGGGYQDAVDGSAPGDKTAKISNLTVGHGDRSYFVRGHSIGVLGHPDSNSLEYSTVINNVKSIRDNKAFTPSKVLLHDSDTSMLLMRPNDEHFVYRMDLNVGKVVEEWKIDDVTPISEILPEAKNAGMTPNRNLVGINHNSIFRIDPRLADSKLVRSESKTYASNVGQFNCATTTAAGKLAVGSSKGDIRLYDKLNVRAKTHLPGLGDAVLGIDTTESGKWVIATCKNYLLLVCTDGRDSKSANGTFSGFNKSLGDQKPFPVRLQLRPEHVAWMGGSVSFTAARFNTSSGNESGEFEETSIVTSTGPFVVTWNFRRVKQGKLNDYTIKQYANDIVADNFKFGEDRNIIVALPEDVHMISKKSLQTPTKMLKSRSSIVNSPF
ncbi:hypothetical protein HK100_007514, partial [Physocladia obscura]